MYIYVVMRKYRRDVWDRAELFDVYANKADAESFVTHKNNMHPSNQPYEYWLIKKKLK